MEIKPLTIADIEEAIKILSKPRSIMPDYIYLPKSVYKAYIKELKITNEIK